MNLTYLLGDRNPRLYDHSGTRPSLLSYWCSKRLLMLFACIDLRILMFNTNFHIKLCLFP